MSEVHLYRHEDTALSLEETFTASRTVHLHPKHGLSTKQFPVSAYDGSSKNLKDLKRTSRERDPMGSLKYPNRATLYLLYTSLCMES